MAGDDLDDIVLQLDHGNIEGAAAQVVNQHFTLVTRGATL